MVSCHNIVPILDHDVGSRASLTTRRVVLNIKCNKSECVILLVETGPNSFNGGVSVHSVVFIISDNASFEPESDVITNYFGSVTKSCVSSGDQFNTLGNNLSSV